MTADQAPILRVEEAHFGYATNPDFLGPVSLSVSRGEFWAIVGPNGAGKSTLLRLLAGLRKPHRGCIRLNGVRLESLPSRRRARQIAFVPQHPPADLEQTVRDIVLMGRFPYRSYSLFESAEDHRVAQAAMKTTHTAAFADRAARTLSGGEAQRVHIAAGLTQEPQVLLLDEPTASLDIQHEQAIFRILKERTRTGGLAVVVVTHDVNLAAAFCTHVLLLSDGAAVASGPPSDIVTPDVLGPVYGVELTTLTCSGDPSRRWVVPAESPNEEHS
ncbi:MAG: ABC transporter ATP-binding protein [Phycisphaerae bacterium]